MHIEEQVKLLLADKSFRVNLSDDARKSTATAIAQATEKTLGVNTERDVHATLVNLPDSIGIKFDEKTGVELYELDGIECDTSCEDVESKSNFDLYFDEEDSDNKLSSFKVFQEIKLAEDSEDDSEDDTVISNIELLRAGEFQHPWYDVINFDKKYFMSCIQNFVNDVVHRDVSFDAQHEPWLGAVAWLKTLNVKMRKFFDGKRRWVMTGDAEFTDKGEEMIRSKRFKYFSVEVWDNYIDRESSEELGPTVTGGGITNRPFITGMLAIELSEDKPNSSVVPDTGRSMSLSDDNNKEVDGKVLALTIDKLDNIIKTNKQNLSLDSNGESEHELPDLAFALVSKDKKDRTMKRVFAHHSSDVEASSEKQSVDILLLKKSLDDWHKVSGFSDNEMTKVFQHLRLHVEELDDNQDPQNNNEGVDAMDFEQMIADLQTKLDAQSDQNSEVAKSYSEQISNLQTIQTDANAKADADAKDNDKKLSDLTAKFEEQNGTIKSLTDKNDALFDRLAVTDEEHRRTRVTLFCETLEKAKHFPATIEVVKKYMLADMSAVAITLSEGEGDDKVKTEINLEKILSEVLETIPSENRVKLGETLRSDGDDTPVNDDSKTATKLSDGNVVELNDEARRKRAIEKAGFKTA